ncbi:MAG: hypothetical protein ACYSQZ_04740 [Planctomycetota bacterium]|jgi:hypothetical protein
MTAKTYPIAAVLLWLQPDSQHVVQDNDSEKITYHVWTGPEPTESEIDAAAVQWQAREDAIATERVNARSELDSGPPPQSLPGLAARVQALEILTGMKTYS